MRNTLTIVFQGNIAELRDGYLERLCNTPEAREPRFLVYLLHAAQQVAAVWIFAFAAGPRAIPYDLRHYVKIPACE